MPLFTTNASICDTTGALLFYTNGIYIANRENDTLTNSKDFNPGTFTDMWAYYGHCLPQGCLFLPVPESDSLYWIFNVTGEFFEAHGGLDLQPLHLSCSLIDASLSNGLGGIVDGYKNIYCIDDTISQGRLTACKHANGRDWWVVTHKYYSDVFYTLLVTPDSIYGQFQQSIGSEFTSNDIWGMAVFSPDGSKYVTISNVDTVEIYDFDRCTGQFSNPVQVIINDPELTLGGAISASSRFLYVNTYTGIYQIDLTVADLQSSTIQVALWDSIDDPFNTYFFLEQLAPDNKIYVSTYNGSFSLHVINSPDSLGLLCNVVQRGLELPDSNSNFSVPNHPNYDLGPLQGSPCDTL